MDFKRSFDEKFGNIKIVLFALYVLGGWICSTLYSYIDNINNMFDIAINKNIFIGVSISLFALLAISALKYFLNGDNERLTIQNDNIIYYRRDFFKLKKIFDIKISEIDYIEEMISYYRDNKRTTLKTNVSKYYLIDKNGRKRMLIGIKSLGTLSCLINIDEVYLLEYFTNELGIKVIKKDSKVSKIFDIIDAIFKKISLIVLCGFGLLLLYCLIKR